jgi:hypothetical protein
MAPALLIGGRRSTVMAALVAGIHALAAKQDVMAGPSPAEANLESGALIMLRPAEAEQGPAMTTVDSMRVEKFSRAR